MTIRIPLRVLLFILYTVALLGGAFGISYAVFEWRTGEDDLATEIAKVDSRVDRVSDRVSDQSHEFSRLLSCDQALYKRVVLGQQSGEVNADLETYCHLDLPRLEQWED